MAKEKLSDELKVIQIPEILPVLPLAGAFVFPKMLFPLEVSGASEMALIDEARRFAASRQISNDRFEFQMLYGVRRDLQEQLVRDGYRMRVYVPFGTQWYPYLMRRLAERPANLAFMTGNILRESMSGRAKPSAGAS